MYVLHRPTFALYAACAVVVATPAAAPAALSPPRIVSTAGLAVQHFGIAMNPAGERSAVAFEGLVRGSRGRTQLFARLGSGRSFGAGQELEDLRSGPGFRPQASISDVRVAVGRDGVAVVAWIVTTVERRDGPALQRAFLATAPAGKRFGRPQTVLRASRNSTIYIAGLVAGARGRAVICLERGSRVEVLVRRRLGTRFGAPQQIGGATASEAPPSLAIASDGTVVAAWTEERVATTKAALLRTGGRRFGSARTISPAGEPTAYGHAVGGPGGTGVTWKHAVPRTTTTPPNTPLRFARLRPGTGTFRAPVTTADVRASGAPQVALPRLGIATAWRNYQVITEPGDNDFFGDSRLSATAPWLGVDGPRGLSALPALALRPAAAALPEHALIAWEQLPAGESDTRVRLAVAGPDGWLPTLTVAPTGASQRPRGRSAILGDERPGAGDLAIAAGRRSALLAYSAVTQDRDGELSVRLRVASYRP